MVTLKWFVVSAICLSKLVFANSTNFEKLDFKNGRNISYDIPDLDIFVRSNFGEKSLEAFGTASNIVILENQLSSHYSKLSWYSLGTPQLIKSSLNTEASATLFHFSPSGFYTYLQLLTFEDMESLASAASEKYNIAVKNNQIRNIPLSKLECSFPVYNNGKSIIVKGSVSDFRNYPLRIDFNAPVGSQLRQVIVNTLDSLNSSTPEIKFSCNLEVLAQKGHVNYLSLTTEDKENLELDERLFGTEQNVSKFSYITAKQLNILASEIFSYFNIMEEYGISLFEFTNLFVENILAQTALSHFQDVSFETVVKNLAKYNLHLSPNSLTPQEITETVVQMFKVQSVGTNQHIFVNETHIEALINAGKITVDESNKMTLLNTFYLGFSLKNAQEVTTDCLQLRMALPDQVKELNKLMQGEMTWALNPNKLFPKTIKVAKLSRSKFNKSLKFYNIKKQVGNLAYSKTISIYTQRAIVDSSNRLLLRKMELLLKKINLTDEKVVSIEVRVNALSNSDTETAKNNALMTETVKKCRLCAARSSEFSCSSWTSDLRLSYATVSGGYSNYNNNEIKFKIECSTT